ncbi:MAG: L-threonylcarbamoyladenylate synthase [Candidatus Eisenbacteria bacterium]|nr:L-threonylcarbamoyladenylate synthase [Candidatus Eisenbacteria bacterium]
MLAGDLALLPAEGVYGLHADGSRPQALERLRALKGSPEGRSFIVLVGSLDQARRYCARFPGERMQPAGSAWPGPLTLILPASDSLPAELRPGGDVALRCPGVRLLRELALSIPGPLVSTSANRAGEAPPRSLAEAQPALLEAVAIAVDGGTLSGKPSTLARAEEDGSLTILRPGLWSS